MNTKQIINLLENSERQLQRAYALSHKKEKGIYSPMTSIGSALHEVSNALAVLIHNFPVQDSIKGVDDLWHIYVDEKTHRVSWITIGNPNAWCDSEIKIQPVFINESVASIEKRVPTCPACQEKYFTEMKQQNEEYIREVASQ